MQAGDVLEKVGGKKDLTFTWQWHYDGGVDKPPFLCQVELDVSGVKVIPCNAREKPLRMARDVFKEAYVGEWTVTDVCKR